MVEKSIGNSCISICEYIRVEKAAFRSLITRTAMMPSQILFVVVVL